MNRGEPSKGLVGSAIGADVGGRFSWVERYLKFCLVGGSGVFVDMAVIYLLAAPHGLGWGLTLSKVIAAEAAILNNFVLNDLWTFRDLGRHRLAAGDTEAVKPSDGRARFGKPGFWRGVGSRFLRFNLICASGIGLSALLLNTQVYLLHLNLFLANFIAIVVVSFWNFFLNYKYGWLASGVAAPGAGSRPRA